MRQGRGARLVVVAIFTGLALSLSGALLAAGANASPGPTASTAAAFASPDRGSGHAAERRRACVSWRTGTMDAKKVRKFVKVFKRTIKSGKDIATAVGIATSTTGIGSLPGAAIAVVAKFGGDFIINFVLNKLTKSLKKYKRVGIKIGVTCTPVPLPKIGFYGPKK